VDGTCHGLRKVAERGSAECRRAGVPDERCVLPLGSAVVRGEVDAHESSWLHRALSLQYELAADVPLRDAPWIGTHNSFNSTSELPTLSHTDSNQQLSLTDQLRIDVRSLELDVHSVPSPRSGADQPAPVVCHGAELHAGCTWERPLGEVLDEIAAWLAAHPDQVLLLYLEDHLDSEADHDRAAAELDSRLTSADGSRSLIQRTGGGAGGCATLPLDTTRADVLAAGAQVVLVGRCGSGAAWRADVFDWGPVEVESRAHGYRDHPTCDQDPDGDGAPELDRTTYGARLVRYYEDSTWLTRVASQAGQATTDDGISPETAGRMVRCGVDLLGFDQILPRDGRLEAVAWSWAPGEPAGGGACAVQGSDGRWRAHACGERHAAACRATDGTWVVVGPPVPYSAAAVRCGARGLRLAVPRTGRENALLLDAARRAGAAGPGGVWLGHRLAAGRWTAQDPR
jgi:hypothetical protein